MLAMSPVLSWAGVYAQWGIKADLTPSTCPGRTSTDSFLCYYWRVNPGAGTDYWIVDSGYGLGLGDGQKAKLTVTHNARTSFAITYRFISAAESPAILELYTYDSSYPKGDGKRSSDGSDELNVECTVVSGKYRYAVSINGVSRGSFTSSTKGLFLCMQSAENYDGNLYYDIVCETAPIKEIPTSPPRPPSGITASTDSSTGVTVRWSSVGGADGYALIRLDDDLDEDSSEMFYVTGTSYVDKTAVPGRTYVYAVAAYNDAGVSEVDGAAYGLRTVSLTASPSSVAASADGGKWTVSLTTTADWTAAASDGWISVSPTSGSGSESFSITVDASDSTAVKSGSVTVTANGGDGPDAVQTITVLQSASPVPVTFLGNGGMPGEQVRAYEAGKTFGSFPQTPLRVGYSFEGWYSGDARILTTSVVPSAPMTLVAHWTPVTYSVSYHGGNEGVVLGAMSDQSMTYDEDAELAACGYARVGYVFAGWATEPGGPVVYAQGETVRNLTMTAGRRVDLYAVWKTGRPSGSATLLKSEVSTRWPWSGIVDIDYEIACDPATAQANVTFSAFDGDRRRGLKMVSVAGDGASGTVGQGRRRLTWDVSADCPGLDTTTLDVSIRVSVRAVGSAQDVWIGSGGAASAILSWKAVADACAYEVWRGSGENPGSARLVATVTTCAYMDSGVEGGVRYNYWVRPLSESCAAEFGDPVAYECPITR